ncbi:MAG: monofunctional biosynthetic peptidoglycan transglycosylase [Bacteroidota bacterium]
MIRLLRAGARWAAHHKVKALLAAAGVFLSVQVLTLPWLDIPRLKAGRPAQTALMEQRMEEARESGRELRIRTTWMPLARIPRHVRDAVVVAEDGTFYTHRGFDWYEVHQSLEENLKEGRRLRGASTITQQLAKNLYLSTSRNPLRKLREAAITLLLEHHLSKNRILELYLNTIEWGPGVFGLEAAARTYFGTSASRLTVEQGARLAAVIPRPLRVRPDGNSRYLMRRTRIVLRRMAARGMEPPPDAPSEEGASGAVTDAARESAADTVLKTEEQSDGL